MRALRRAASAYIDLLRRLETDGYLKTAERDGRIIGIVLHEMAAYSVANAVRSGTEIQKALDNAMRVFLPEEDALEQRIREGVRRRAGEFLADKDEIPSCYKVIRRFDELAAEQDWAFYERLGVSSPGKLSDRYDELLQGFERVIEDASF